MKYSFSTVFFFFIVFCAKAQFTDSTTRFIKLVSTGSFNKTKEGSNYLFNNNVQFNVRKKRTSVNSTATWIYGMTPHNLTNNDINVSTNVNLYRHIPEFYYWGLVNFISSYSLNIIGQGQAGIGVAYNFINKENIWLNVSNGVLGEVSRIIENDTTLVNDQTIRNSLRIQFLYKMGDRLTFRTGHFFQPSFQYISDHIITSDTELSYQLWKGLNLNAKLLYNKMSRTQKENLILTYGIGYQKSF